MIHGRDNTGGRLYWNGRPRRPPVALNVEGEALQAGLIALTGATNACAWYRLQEWRQKLRALRRTGDDVMGRLVHESARFAAFKGPDGKKHEAFVITGGTLSLGRNAEKRARRPGRSP